jgi:hypothetical protein
MTKFETRFGLTRAALPLGSQIKHVMPLLVNRIRELLRKHEVSFYRRIERQYGNLSLPSTVDSESIIADYDKGVLKIRLAKKAEAKPKQIKVNVGSRKSLRQRNQKRRERRMIEPRTRATPPLNSRQ